jgi:type IV secretion system protein VirB4
MHHTETEDYISSGLVNYLHETLTQEQVNFNIPKPAIDLDIQIGHRDLFLTNFTPKIGNKYVQCISISKFPEKAYPNILNSLDMLNISYRWSTRFIFLEKQQSESLLKKYYNKWDEKVISWKDNLIQRAGLNPGRIDSDALDMAEDANTALNEARSDIVKYGYYTSSIIIMHEDKKELARQADVISSLIQNSNGFNTQLETWNNMESFLGSQAGHLNKNVRRPIMHTLNLATLINLSSIYSGQQYSPNPFLPPKSPPLAYARTNGSTPYRLNLHHKDVGHTLIVGRTGGGKSTLLSFILAQWLRYPKAKVFAFDKKESLYAITKSVGGIHYHLAKDKMVLCPLALVKEDDQASLAWASEYISSLVDLQNIKLSALQKINIYETIKLIAKQPNKSLSSFILAIGDSDISYALRCYTEDGALGSLLDGEENQINISHFNTFELDSLLKMGEKNLAAVLGYLFHYIEKQLDGSPTIIALEEVWLVMMRDFFKDKFNEWLVTLRKQNCSVVFTCQNLGQLHKDIETLSAVVDSTATKIFLPNPDAGTKGTADIPGNYDLYIRFGLNDHEINNIVSKSIAKRDYYIKQEEGSRLVQFDFGQMVLGYCGISGTEEIANFKAQANQELIMA